jgi:hypothetical protein
MFCLSLLQAVQERKLLPQDDEAFLRDMEQYLLGYGGGLLKEFTVKGRMRDIGRVMLEVNLCVVEIILENNRIDVCPT